MQGWDPEDAKAWDRHFGTDDAADALADWLWMGTAVVIVVGPWALGIWKALELVGLA